MRELLSCCAKRPFYANKTFITASVLLGVVILSAFLPWLVPFRDNLIAYFKNIWWAVILGFLIGGIIEYYIPREYISLILAHPGKRTILYSVVLGFLMSVCSHGILALSIQLHKKGASNASVISFLLASPWANMVITMMLVSFFGWKALFIIFSAMAVAMTTGFTFQFLERKKIIEANKFTATVSQDFSISEDFKKRFKAYRFSLKNFILDVKGVFRGAASLADMVLWWILIGTAIASLAGAYIPSHIFNSYMGPTFLGLLITLLAATIIEVCSEGSSPMAFEIFRQTGALGNSFVFLMAGVVTDYTEIGLVWQNLGRRAALAMVAVSLPQVIALGFIANLIFK